MGPDGQYQIGADGQKVEVTREDEVVYVGRQYQMPNKAKVADLSVK